MYVAKWNSAGALQWPNTVSSYNSDCNGVVADGAGCAYITGAYAGSITLGSITLTGAGESVFIAKLDAAGNYLWAKSVSGSSSDWDMGSGMTIDSHANIYISGSYTGSTTVFGSFTAPATTSPSLFIAEYDSSGNAINLITAVGAGIPVNTAATDNAITIDTCGYLYVTGAFPNTAQFGGTTLTSVSPNDVYVAKCTNSGTWLWANSINCGTGQYGGGCASIALDKYTNVYIGVNFPNGTATLGGTSVSGDILIAKYDNGTGNLDWAQSAGASGNGDDIFGITVDNYGFAYVTGGYVTTAPFGSTTLTNPGGGRQTIFVDKMDTPLLLTVTPLFTASDSTLGDRLYCAGQTYPLNYTTTGTFNSGNTFTAQLSDSSGKFSSPVTIGSVNSTTNGTISITIPGSTVYGIHYLIRIISSDPTINNTAAPTSTCYVYPSADTTYFYCTIFPMPTPLITGIDSICQGDSTTLTASGGLNYLWSNGSTDSSITVSPFGTTQYIVSVSNGPCILNDSVTVKVDSLQLTVLPKDTMIILGDSLTYQASGAKSYKWSPDSALSCDSCSNPTASPTVTTTYIITGTSTEGCVAMDTVIVVVKPILCDAKLLANAFTPGNAEGGNNMLYIQNQIALSQIQVFRIYNRWGELVFQTNDINAGWDGTFNGSPEPIGVYVWYIQGICRGHSVMETGNVTLLR
jgi:gliding motility-associated-like protein